MKLFYYLINMLKSRTLLAGGSRAMQNAWYILIHEWMGPNVQLMCIYHTNSWIIWLSLNRLSQNETWLLEVPAKESQIEGSVNNVSTGEQEFSSELTLPHTSSLSATLWDKNNDLIRPDKKSAERIQNYHQVFLKYGFDLHPLLFMLTLALFTVFISIY